MLLEEPTIRIQLHFVSNATTSSHTSINRNGYHGSTDSHATYSDGVTFSISSGRKLEKITSLNYRKHLHKMRDTQSDPRTN